MKQKSSTLVILSHLIGWFLFLSLIFGFVTSFSNDDDVLNHLFSPYFLLFVLVYAFLYYFNSGFLFPRLYLQKRYVPFFSAIVVLFAAVYLLKPFDRLISGNHELENPAVFNQKHRPPMTPFGEPRPGRDRAFKPPGRRGGPRGHNDIVSVILFVMIVSFSSAISILKQWRLTEQRAAQAETEKAVAEAEKATAELSFLKAQINPHFLFNTLNNIYSMAVTKNENTPDSILKLSHIMRYVTDEVNQELVPLQSEVDCIADYISLQSLRLNKKAKLEISLAGSYEGRQIPPLVLMPFVENAFKYGISSHEPSIVKVEISLHGNTIHFFCENRIFGHVDDEQRTGIGITNTKKRLKFHYQNRHLLDISQHDGLYTVNLSLPS